MSEECDGLVFPAVTELEEPAVIVIDNELSEYLKPIQLGATSIDTDTIFTAIHVISSAKREKVWSFSRLFVVRIQGCFFSVLHL